jgi:hypothetical protein
MVRTHPHSRFVVLFATLALCLGADKKHVQLDADALADIVRPTLPKCWTISIKDGRVLLDRGEPVELFNPIQLPADGKLRDEMIKASLRRKQLRIELWPGQRLSADEFREIERKNAAANSKAQKEHHKDAIWHGDEKFWREHPEYGYRKLPMLDAGSVSIYMNSTPKCLYRPELNPPLPPERAPAGFYNEAVGIECQGVLDGLANRFQRYP